MMNAQQVFGLRIKTLRRQANMSQLTLALMVGVSTRYLSDIECGRRNLTLRVIVKLAEGLDVSLSELFDGVDSDD